ncbi:MAG: hypothetical protein V4568_12005 [Pseudomonadota bacterium]
MPKTPTDKPEKPSPISTDVDEDFLPPQPSFLNELRETWASRNASSGGQQRHLPQRNAADMLSPASAAATSTDDVSQPDKKPSASNLSAPHFPISPASESHSPTSPIPKSPLSDLANSFRKLFRGKKDEKFLETPEFKAQVAKVILYLDAVREFNGKLILARSMNEKALDAIDEVGAASAARQANQWEVAKRHLNRVTYPFVYASTNRIGSSALDKVQEALPPNDQWKENKKRSAIENSSIFKEISVFGKELADTGRLVLEKPIVGESSWEKINEPIDQWAQKPEWSKVRLGFDSFYEQNLPALESKLINFTNELKLYLTPEKLQQFEQQERTQFETQVGAMVFWALEKVLTNKEVIIDAIKKGDLETLGEMSRGQGPLRALTMALEQLKTVEHPRVLLGTELPKSFVELKPEAEDALKKTMPGSIVVKNLGDNRTFREEMGDDTLPRLDPNDTEMTSALAQEMDEFLSGTIREFHHIISRELKLDSPDIKASLKKYYSELRGASSELHSLLNSWEKTWKAKLTPADDKASLEQDDLSNISKFLENIASALRDLTVVTVPNIPPHLSQELIKTPEWAKQQLDKPLIAGVKLADLTDENTFAERINSLDSTQRKTLTQNVGTLVSNVRSRLGKVVDSAVAAPLRNANQSNLLVSSVALMPTENLSPVLGGPQPVSRNKPRPDSMQTKHMKSLTRTKPSGSASIIKSEKISFTDVSSAPMPPSFSQPEQKADKPGGSSPTRDIGSEPILWSSIDGDIRKKIKIHFTEVVTPALVQQGVEDIASIPPENPSVQPENFTVKNLESLSSRGFTVQVFKIGNDRAIGLLVAGKDTKNFTPVTLPLNCLSHAHKEEFSRRGEVHIRGNVKDEKISVRASLTVDTNPAPLELKDLESLGSGSFTVQVLKMQGARAIGLVVDGAGVKPFTPVTLPAEYLLPRHRDALADTGEVKISGDLNDGKIAVRDSLIIDTEANATALELKKLESLGSGSFTVQIFKGLQGKRAIGLILDGPGVKPFTPVTLPAEHLTEQHRNALAGTGEIKITGNLNDGKIAVRNSFIIDANTMAQSILTPVDLESLDSKAFTLTVHALNGDRAIGLIVDETSIPSFTPVTLPKILISKPELNALVNRKEIQISGKVQDGKITVTECKIKNASATHEKRPKGR